MISLSRLLSRQIFSALLAVTSVFTLSSCHEHEEYADDGAGNFMQLWEIIDQHYCFFEEKDIDWAEVGRKYAAQLKGTMTYDEYFNILAAMLDELEDGHVNLSSTFNTSYYRKWWSDYPQDFNLRTLQQYYLDFDYRQTSGISYRMLDGEIGYIYYTSFSSTVGNTNLDQILAYFAESRALIIDIRDNGGGALTNIDTYVARFITEPTLGGYICHKTGPGHNDFSEPYAIVYKPCSANRISYLNRPIMLLTNRSCFSAANAFASVMSQLPNVRIVGARTGGGGGLPFSSELPIGWTVRFSACPLFDANLNSIENGIDPTPGYEVHCTDTELALGHDAILDFALAILREETADPPQETPEE